MSFDVKPDSVRLTEKNRQVLVRRGLIAALMVLLATIAYSFVLVFQFHSAVAVFQKQNAILETAYRNDQGEIIREPYGTTTSRFLVPAPLLRYHRSLFAISLRYDPNSNPEEIDELFNLLHHFPKLSDLVLEGFLIDPERAAAIARIADLKGLALKKCQIENSCLASVLQIKGLIEIRLADSEFQEAELEILSQGPAKETLRALSLSNCEITDTTATVLSRCRNLEFLELDGTQVTDLGLKQLARLPQLRVLVLDHTPVTDAGVIYLSATPNLIELSLSNTSASDAMLETLKQEIPALRVSDD